MMAPDSATNTGEALPETCGCGVALADQWGQAYNEAAFRYFLAIERKRAIRSGRPLLLLLVDVREQAELGRPINDELGRQILSRLQLCLRESDLVGWYREGWVAGAVLTESGNWPWADVARRVSQRISAALAARLPWDVASRLRVRLHQDPATENIEPAAPIYEGTARSRRI
jgi:hypothetical protein